jgi:hypothetical protein
MPHSLFRLRISASILGYMKVFSNGITEYSKDQFWWFVTPIEYRVKDQFSGLKDKTNRSLFELDVVTIKLPKKPRTMGIVHFDSIAQAFMVIDLETHKEHPAFVNNHPTFHRSHLTFTGFSFADEYNKE